MAQVGSLAVRVSADTRPYRQGMRDTRGPAQRMRRSMNQVAKRAAKMGAAIAAAGAAITAHLVRSGLDAVDTQQKLARQLGSTQAEIAGVTRAAKDAGIESGQLESNLQALNKRLGEAQEGSGRAADTLDRLGLSAQELAEMPLDERLDTIGAAINSLETQTEKAAATSDLFSRSGLNMMNVFAQGEGAIQQAANEAEQFGVAVSEVDARQIEAANDAMSRIGDVVQGISNQLAAQFAPILQGIAELLTENAKETKGFADEISELADRGVKAFAFLADAVEGVRRTFVIVAQAAVQAFLEVRRGALEAAQFIEGTLLEQLDNLLTLMRALPGAQVARFALSGIDTDDVSEDLQHARRMVDEGRAAMQETLMEPMPSDAITRWVEDVRVRSAEAASSVEDAMARINQAQAGELDTDDGDGEDDKEDEAFKRRMAQLRDFLNTRREAEIADHEERMDFLEEALEERRITQQEHDKLEEELKKKHQERLTAIERQGLSDREKFEAASMKKRVGMVSDQLKTMTATVANENKAMFNLNKAAAISSAIIDAYAGINKTLSAYPYPLSVAMASAQAAAAFAQVNAIKSQSFGGGGGTSAPSLAGGTAAPPVSDVGASGGGQSVERSITIRGEGVSQEWIRESLAPALNEAAGDGVVFRGA